MRRNFYFILMLLLLMAMEAGAQNIRYVSKSGAYANDGKSWATAKINVQDAINDLVDNGLTGEVWVAAGTYTPTESTESSGGSTLYMSFKIPAGIKVYGGFAGTETSKDQRAKTTYESLGWRYTNHTTLSGNLSAKAEFSWNSSKKVYNTSFYGNSYHVVWFANNGFDASGRANALSAEALLEGFIIEGGNARNTALTGRSHTAYGGGIYMVEGATVQNCYVTNCEASRDGGGIYMDGGGTVEHTLIANCQALGVSIDNGYGGGICLDGNASENKFGITRSMIYNCVARYGGGMAINVPTLKSAAGNDIRYKPYAAAMIITNNTATSEGGGVYLNRGGAVTQLTVVANQCNGQGVTTNGITNGRAAGIYCRDNSYVINSVLWGGECAANNNAQYAASRSSYSDDLKTHMWYCSLSKSGYVDWSSTKKITVMSLSDYNTKTLESAAGVTSGASVGYPVFAKPTPSAGHLGNDVFDFAGTYSWQPQAVSALLNAGIRSIELDLDGILPFPLVLYDLVDAQFKPHATIGGYVAKGLTISPQTSGSTVNIYVDDAGTQGAEAASIGSSWDTPIRYLGNALQYVKDNAATLSGKTVNIYVKEGTYNNTNSYVDGRLRMVPIDVPSNVNLYGGYPDELTGTDLSATINGTLYQRNPLRYPSIITGKVTNDYQVNVAHLVTFNGSTDVVFDGFQVRYANASSTLLTNTDKNGGGMIFSNGARVSVRNTLIAGCTAEKGAAIFATGASQVTFVNCIIHNNTSSNLNGIIYSEGTANLTFNQCNFLRNVGYVGYLEGTDTKQAYTNSIFFANMDRAIDNTNAEAGGGIQYSLPSFAGNTAGVSGSYCMFDAKSAQFSAQFGGNPLGKWQYNLQYTFAGGADNGYPRFVNPTKNTGVSPGGDATFNGRATSFEPNNTNPVVNAAYAVGDHTAWGTDISVVTTRDYGGRPDIGAVENHQATHEAEGENAYTTGQPAYGSVVYVRDYNTYTYNADGTMTKTAEDLTTNDRDGLSWERAINGNATYGIATTFVNYNLSTPVASTIASPKPYKIGMLLGNTPGNAVYFAKQNGTAVYMNGTTTAAAGDDFILIATATTGVYYIYNVTRSQYVAYNSTTTGANKIVLQATNTTNARWRIISVNTAANYQTYVIQPGNFNNIFSPSWNYYGGAAGGNNIGLQAGTDANSKWQFYVKVTTTGTVDVNGFQYALNNANALYTSTGKAHKVWVGAGNYTTTLTMRDGAPAYGGFPKSGTPGESERNISNTDNDYKTIIDANKAGRVLTQSVAFADTTMFEGFILRNGATTGTNYGAGAYLMKNGMLKNCLIENNAFTSNSSTADKQGGGGLYLNSGSLVKNSIIRKNTVNGSGLAKYVGGAGVFSARGELQNSLIVENTTTSTAYFLLGAGMYISATSKLYNCTIAYNFGNQGGSYPATGGVWDAGATYSNGSYSNQSLFYNCIMWGNYANGNTAENMIQVGMSGFSSGAGRTNNAFFTCYSSAVNSTYASDDATDRNKVYITGTSATPGAYQAFYDACKANEPFVRASDGTTTYALKSTATQCINQGSQEDVLAAQDITEDIVGSNRVQDCTVDKGAYEYNDAYGITPDTKSVSGQAIFYVTPEGHGLASASTPGNAACAAKLQTVLDAAGRYKYTNPAARVIVKLANSSSLEGTDTPFKYYATRTTDVTDQDVRLWSIMVPRGVEVWGGYTDTYTSETDNGFFKNDGTYTDRRNIIAHPTYLDSYYYNTLQKNDAYTYHVVTFTDYVFDSNGLPYRSGDSFLGPSTFTSYQDNLMSMAGATTDRAVIDGLFVTGGNANLQVTSSGSTTRDINQYGGAAIVTDYAHVRNCIIRDNKATYGGALALTHRALVSGTLIDRNTAEYGGALYFFEDGVELSDGTIVDTKQGSGTTLDANMPHVYTSTIVNNLANAQGGGIWFGQGEANVRINSSVVWQNHSPDQANVSGLSNPEKPADNNMGSTEFYPFSFSAVQNVRLSGTNNIDLPNTNREGTRFVKAGSTDQVTLAKESGAEGFDNFSDFGYYGLTNYSILVKTGMSINDYEALKSIGVTDADFAGLDRVTSSTARSFIDIGARAIDKRINTNNLMLRLYVMKPEDVDMDAAETMMQVGSDPDPSVAYYGQEGSSFAYPMQSLQDALDYIYAARAIQPDGTLAIADANNMPFEIVVAKGTYYPSRDLRGDYGYSLDNTFLIPEGVAILGGFSGKRAVDRTGTIYATNNFFGRFRTKGTVKDPNYANDYYHLTDNTDTLTTEALTIGDYTIRQLPMEIMTKYRPHADINANNIIEPWEFTNQTVLSGDVNNVPGSGVLHVVTVYADQTVAGALPKPSMDRQSTYVSDKSNAQYGYTIREDGQPIVLDGLTITGGYARKYVTGSIDDKEKLYYEHGGGLFADGNRYCDDYNKGTSNGQVFMYSEVPNPISYRDVSVVVTKCKFEDNHGGFGGAIAMNSSLNVYSSSFEHNIAEAGVDANVDYKGSYYTVNYPGQGGAIFSTNYVTAVNSLFANNEARDSAYTTELQEITNLRHLDSDEYVTPKLLGGSGGAIYMGKSGFYHLFNCNFVHNMANAYPAICTMNPNTKDPAPGSADYNMTLAGFSQIFNSVFWGNEVNDMMKSKYSANAPFMFAGQLITTYGKPDRTGDYNAAFTADNVPTSQTDLDDNYQEMAWFSAYEAGRGITPVNTLDLRGLAIDPMHHVVNQLAAAAEAQGGSYQNCNIGIASDNEALDGPNFVNPSLHAGYDGYVESADWSPSRLNKLTDSGSGKIDQIITQSAEGTYQAEFKTYDASTVSQVPTDYSSAGVGDYMASGFYSTYRYWKYNMFYHRFVPIGTDEYMTSAYVQEDGSQQQLYRISYDPNPTHNQTYIDIGVYEYPHTPLQYTTVGDEVDILWVSPIEKPDNGLPDGSAWSQPTSDLQRAIETLLASRNGHRKEIRLLDGSYTPIYTINNRLAFTINTYDLNDAVELPEAKEGYTSEGHGVRSLTIKGGYSRELNNIYDVDAYPAVFRQQTRTDASSDKWDHLIYITDASQRYGLSSYNTDNGQGWWPTAAEQTAKPVNTIPIEIDGVRVINDQAKGGTNGAGIYYGPQTFNANMMVDASSASPAYIASSPTTANISKIVYYKDEALTEVSETPTAYYKREGETYYTDDTYTTVSPTPTNYVRYGYVQNTAPAKLLMSKSTILGTGTKNDKTTNAVYISSTGGSALLYNNLMHSNYGEPLHAECPTTVVNNTFALNASLVNISGDAAGGSKIFNSVFWRNNATGTDTYGEQFALKNFADVASSGDIFRRNAFTGGNTVETNYAAGSVIAGYNYNVGLSANNNDVINGPNFVDPENTNIEARNFGINPSLRLLNKGDNGLYNDVLTTADYNIYDLAWLTTTRHDAASSKRIVTSIDLGAFEYQNNLERVLYVNPNSSVTGVGNSWASPLGYGSLQTALDLAAIYHVNNPSEEAYVFVKGASLTNSGLHTGETLIMRDGVTMYGGISPSFNADCAKTTDENGVTTFAETDLNAYIANIRVTRGPIVGPTGNKTTVSGIKVSPQSVFDTAEGITSLIDGVEVTAATATNTTGAVTAPVIDVRPQTANAHVALRNIIVRNNTVTTPGVNVAEVDNALLYEALFHTNTPGDGASTLRVGTSGYVVNATVEGTTIGADGLTTYNGSEAGHIYNSLVNYADRPATSNTLSGSHYRVSLNNLNYQLMAKSTHIDECDPVNPLATAAPHFAEFINYDTDLDLLGNPRLLKGVTTNDRVDRGAFETWRIDRQVVQTLTTDNFYPHDGSVVYILEGNSLVSGTTLTPAFLLLEKGASLYGQGHAVNAAYLAVERDVPAGGAVVSLPYEMNYADNAAKVSYADDGELTLTPGGSAYTYNGLRRSAWNYQFLKTESGCWDALSTTAAASQGVLFIPAEAGTYRFTGQGASMQDYIYREVQDATQKTVTLTQNDDYRSDYGGADFTSKEDMGWNCIGLPYLVSAYKPYIAESFTGNSRYNMDIPHKLWLYYDGAAAPDGSTVNGDGGYYSVSSWDTTDNWHLPTGSIPSVWVGEGIFTQTATVSLTEDLTFYRPVYESASGAKAAPTLTRAYVGTIEQEVATTFSITTRGRIIYVTGLEGDEQITIYDQVGRIYNTAQATSARYSTAVPTNGIYIVRVNDVSKKVLIK